MSNFKYYLSSDYFNIGHFGDKHVKRINLSLFISSIIVLITIIFYIIMYSFTNFSTLDDLQEYTYEYIKKDKEIAQIELAAKIMPSYNFAKNAIWMTKTREVKT